jgi:hypothetical protein
MASLSQVALAGPAVSPETDNVDGMPWMTTDRICVSRFPESVGGLTIRKDCGYVGEPGTRRLWNQTASKRKAGGTRRKQNSRRCCRGTDVRSTVVILESKATNRYADLRRIGNSRIKSEVDPSSRVIGG